MNKRLCLALVSLLYGVLLSACGPSEAERQATVTQVAAAVFATQTAQAPTVTPTFTPSPTATATSTSTPTGTPTPLPTATNTPVPTATSTPTKVPTWTPTPTKVPVISQAQAETILRQFMNLMVKKDAEKAFALFAKQAQEYVTLADIKELVDANYVLFDGFQALKVATIYGSPTFAALPGYEGTTATVEGVVLYQGNFIGTIKAVFRMNGDAWQLMSVYVVVPPEKIKSMTSKTAA